MNILGQVARSLITASAWRVIRAAPVWLAIVVLAIALVLGLAR